MISIKDALDDIIKTYPLIEEGLSKGFINYSAFAREIKPQIEKKLYKKVKEGAVVMALKRISQSWGQTFSQRDKKLNLTDLTVRSNLIMFTFVNSDSLIVDQREVFNQLSDKKGIFCAISQGVRETTLIANADAGRIIEDIFSKETLVAKIESLSSISIYLPEETIATPGIYYQVLKILAWEKINLIEIISTYTEITVVFENKDINKAFSALSNLKSL